MEKLEDRLALAPIVTPHYEIPNFGDYETIHSDSSGAWSNPDTWSAGRVPTANDVVVISAGTSVTYDLASSAALDSVVIYAGGLLNFRTDISTQMLVTNLQVLEGGELRVGTAANPVAADVTAQIIIRNVALDTVRDPSQFGNGLIGLGKITMHGANRVSYVRLDAEPRVGHTTLTLEAPATGWRVGDKLILPDSKQWLRGGETYLSSIETVTIAAISADRKTITLTTPLQFDHPGARNGNDVLEFLPHVVNRTRNIVVRSESATGTRGYVLFTGRADVDVRYASFAGTGRTKLGAANAANPTDRFPVTFSHLYGPAGGQANGYQYTFVGNAVFCPLQEHEVKWGIGIRDSHYGLIKGNVLFNWAGSSLVTLQGNETENRIEGNFAVGGRGRGDNVGSFGGVGLPGDEGAGFWFFGPNNRILNNVATSCMNPNGFAAYGYKIYNGAGTVRIPNFAGADTTIAGQYTVRDTATQRILEWDGNEGYGLEDGLTFWYVNTIGAVPQNGGESVIKNSLMWHIAHYGYFGYPTADVTFDGWVQRGYKPYLQNEHLVSIGLTNGDYFADHFRVRNADIQGLTYGIMDGTYGDSDHLIENSYLRNVQNIAWSTLRAPGSGGAPVNRMPRSLTIRNVTFGSTASWNVGATPRANIALRFVPDPFEAANLIQSDTIFVENYNGTGTNYQVFYNEQRADFIVPQTNASGSLLGSPVAGLTNQQNWDQFGIAIAGAVAPAGATTVPGILGLAKSFVVPPDSTSPSSPTGLSAAAASTSQINLTWTAATDNLGVAGYRIYRNGAHVGTTSATSYSAMGLAAGTNYTFTVVAFDSAGNVSAASAPASATTLSLPSADSTPPSAPADLAGTAASNSRIDLTWNASTDNVQVAGYRIFRNGTQIGTTSTTSFAATGLAAGTTYNFIVRAYDAAGNVSGNSNTATVSTLSPPAGDTTDPSAPTGLAGTAVSTSRINLTWNAATDNVGVTGYRIFRNGVQIATSTTTSFAATGLAAGTTYNFIVRAYDAAGNVSGNSNTATVATLSPPPADTTAPSAPTGLEGTAASTSRINLTWNASSDNVQVEGYRIFRNGVYLGTSSTTSYAATDLVTGTTYNFIVRAYDAAGNVSGNSNTATVTTLSPPGTDTTRPSAPTGLAGTAASNSRVNLTWDAATDNVAVTGYRIFRNGVGIGTTSSRSFAATGLAALTTYDFTVRAYDAAGNVSGNSNTATVTTLSPPPADTTAPSAPTGLAGTAASASRIDLAWNASADNVQVTGYRIFRNGVVIGTTSSTSYAATGLAAGTTYNFIVRAYDAAGNVSGNSNTASVTTLAPPPPPAGGGIVDDGAAGNRVTSGWNMGFGRGYMGDVHIAPKGTGSRSATWTFTGLANGQYNAWVTFTANGKNATNAPFSIHNGNSGKTPVVKVNQRFAPTHTISGFKWRFLTKVNVVNGWAMVKLTNNANGNVIADAVRLLPAPAAAPLPAALPASAMATSVALAKPPLSARTFLAFASAAHSQGQSTSSVQQTAPQAETPAPGAAHDQVFGGGSDVGPESALLDEAVNLLSEVHDSDSEDGSSSVAIDQVLASSAN